MTVDDSHPTESSYMTVETNQAFKLVRLTAVRKEPQVRKEK